MTTSKTDAVRLAAAKPGELQVQRLQVVSTTESKEVYETRDSMQAYQNTCDLSPTLGLRRQLGLVLRLLE
jgi:hypothetical protein